MTPRTLALAGLIAFCAAPLVAAQTTTVTLKKLVEKRELTLVKDAFSGSENGIELTLHIDGPGVKGARKFGMIKITKALDDTGTDLARKGEGVGSFAEDNYQDVREPMSFGMSDNAPKPTGFDIDLKLQTPSARNAKLIKQIAGEIKVIAGGEKKVIEVKQLKQKWGKTIDDPALKALGVTFQLVDPAKPQGMMMGDPQSSVPAIISGKPDAIAEVRIVDASGEKLNSGSSWNDENNTRKIVYSLDKPLADDMVMQIECWVGEKTVTVPIDLKDVNLP